MRAARRLVLLAGVCFAAVIVIVSGARLRAMASGAEPGGATGEARFRRWADRDPPLVGRLEDAARSLETGRAVVPVCAPECETSWFGTMAMYALPRQAVVPAKTQGQLGAGVISPTRILRTAAEVRVEPRSEADGGR